MSSNEVSTTIVRAAAGRCEKTDSPSNSGSSSRPSAPRGSPAVHFLSRHLLMTTFPRAWENHRRQAKYTLFCKFVLKSSLFLFLTHFSPLRPVLAHMESLRREVEPPCCLCAMCRSNDRTFTNRDSDSWPL